MKLSRIIVTALAALGFVAGLTWFCVSAYRLAQLIGSVP